MDTSRTIRSAVILAALAASAAISLSAGSGKKKTEAARPETLQISTASAAAKYDYGMGLLHREDLLFVEEGLNYFRKAVTEDPHFALGHAAVAYFTTNPAEEQKERALSEKNIRNASDDEKLLIRWMNGTKDGHMVPAIAAMNDLLGKYPKDKQLANMFAEWLGAVQGNYVLAEEILSKILAQDANYYPAINNLAYDYSLAGDYAKSPALMERYVAALPGQPNPQDSYGELLRMAGDYQDAIEHYRTALRITPSFTTSQLGIASTYALMGDEGRARTEYLKAIDMTKEAATKQQYRMLWAMTYYRQGDVQNGRKEFQALALRAHQEGLGVLEAECQRTMALFNPDPQGALTDLDSARAVLSEKHEISSEDHDAELAAIVQTRAFIAVRAGMPDEAGKAIGPLADIAQKSRNEHVQQSFHSANGAMLLAAGKYAEAISELQEDPRNPLSLALLAEAQNKAGQAAEAQKTMAVAAAVNDERVETAFAVPQVRAMLKGNSVESAQAKSH